MAKGIIGQPFTFNVMFLDDDGLPFTPLAPTIEVFYFNLYGGMQNLIASGTPLVPVTGVPGRYAYTVDIPSSLSPAIQLYGIMSGTSPTTGVVMTTEQSVDLFTASTGACGTQVSFTRPFQWP